MAARRNKSTASKGKGIPSGIKDVLNDPWVRARIVEHAGAIIDVAKQAGGFVRKNVGGKFGQKGLERRAANVRAAVAALSRDSPDLAAALRPVTKSLDEVDQLLKVSAALPFAKRKKAHMKIDDNLDNLESGLFDATLRGAPPTAE